MVTDLDRAIEAIDEAIDHLSETEALYAREEPCEIIVNARSGLLTILEHLDTLAEAKHAEKLDRWRR